MGCKACGRKKNYMEIKGIIFDYGGTIDTDGDHWSHIIRDGWNKAGIAADDALFREAYVYGERELERTLKILPQHDFSDLMNIKIQLELQYLAQNGDFPPAQVEAKAAEIASYCYEVAKENTSKARSVLQMLSKKYPIVLVSNFYGNLDSVLKDFGLSDCFKKVIESAKVGVRKPSSAILEMGISALHLKPEEVLVVGDSFKNDIAPARKLGCQTLLLDGKKWEGEETISPDELKTINSLDEIFKFLESYQEI